MMNTKVEFERVVEEDGLASSMKSGTVNVLATPQMIAWMEEAASQCLNLNDDLTSVGTKINVSHIKASPLGAVIRIVATITNVVNDRTIEFWVQAFQGDDLIGEGSHERVIVNSEKFVNKTYNFK
ncbi:hypothetical protein C815_00700 [Firmicutes bacterium M10-2]|nr:hypothetical protein C815_00700 [Firmicutes bacterium M10-2]